MVTCIPLLSGPLAAACYTALSNVAALPVHPMGWTVLVEQADVMPSVVVMPHWRASCSAASISNVANALPPERPSHGDLVDLRNAAVPASGKLDSHTIATQPTAS
jgi:hypothetical protein